MQTPPAQTQTREVTPDRNSAFTSTTVAASAEAETID
jgi:hypothetical protein